MESRKAEHNVELGRFKEELESLKSEHQKMEAEIKKQKLVFYWVIQLSLWRRLL